MKTRFIAALTLLGALAPAFAQPANREIVRVNGVPILQSDVLERLWRRYGPAMVSEMVDEVLLGQAAEAQKIKADPAEIDRRVQIIRGQFPEGAPLEEQLKQAGSSLETLKDDLGRQLVQEKLIVKQKSLAVSEDELKKAFAARRKQLDAPQAVHLRHILLKTAAEAKDVIAKIKGGADFKTLAKERSLAPTGKLSGGDYGFVARGMLPPEIEEVAFSLKPGEIKSTSSPKGVHVLQAAGTRAAVPAEFSKVKDQLRQMVLADKIKAVLPEYLAELRQKAEIKSSAAEKQN